MGSGQGRSVRNCCRFRLTFTQWSHGVENHRNPRLKCRTRRTPEAQINTLVEVRSFYFTILYSIKHFYSNYYNVTPPAPSPWLSLKTVHNNNYITDIHQYCFIITVTFLPYKVAKTGPYACEVSTFADFAQSHLGQCIGARVPVRFRQTPPPPPPPRPLPRVRSFFPRLSPTPEQILPETDGNACNAG